MSRDCTKCNKSISSRSPGLQCSGGCDKFFHASCVGIPKSDLAHYKTDGVFWKCRDCRESANCSIIVDSDPAPPSCSSASSVTELHQVLKSIQTDIRDMNKKYDELLKSITFYGGKIDDFETTLKGLGDKMKRLESVAAENVKLKSVVSDLTSRVEHLEQYSRLNNLILSGIPEKKDEDLKSVVSQIGVAINCPVTENNIDAIHRLPSRNPLGENGVDGNKRSRGIVIKFLSRNLRDQFLSAAKMYRKHNNIESPGININDLTEKLFINEHLTPLNATLFRNAKEKCREKGYKYCWLRNCVIHVRREDRARVMVIKSDADLKKL